MQFIRIHCLVGAIAAIALAATAISAPAASARVLDGPLHQTGQARLALHAPAQASALRAVDAQAALAHSHGALPIVRSSSPERNALPESTPTSAVPAPRLAPLSGSFHWGDAAIGAGVAIVIVLLVTTGTVVVRRRTQFGEA